MLVILASLFIWLTSLHYTYVEDPEGCNLHCDLFESKEGFDLSLFV
ncbi:unnamed protein product, partial [Arabidopsis halleri]